jgi:hypothetical protein
MKNLLLLFIGALTLGSCSESTINSNKQPVTVSTSGLLTTINVENNNPSKEGQLLIFKVKNLGDSTISFCKWHTPFEPLMSKYLDVTNNNGEEMAYKGPMAKRIMPPPADSYIAVKPGDSVSVEFDLLKGYEISKPGTYVIKYNSNNISGLTVRDSLILDYKM